MEVISHSLLITLPPTILHWPFGGSPVALREVKRNQAQGAGWFWEGGVKTNEQVWNTLLLSVRMFPIVAKLCTLGILGCSDLRQSLVACLRLTWCESFVVVL